MPPAQCRSKTVPDFAARVACTTAGAKRSRSRALARDGAFATTCWSDLLEPLPLGQVEVALHHAPLIVGCGVCQRHTFWNAEMACSPACARLLRSSAFRPAQTRHASVARTARLGSSRTKPRRRPNGSFSAPLSGCLPRRRDPCGWCRATAALRPSRWDWGRCLPP